MLLGHGAVYDEQYYTVAPPMEGAAWREMYFWCEATFGPSTGSIWIKSNIRTPNERWYQNNGKFWFRSEADLSWFLLKWS